MNELLHNIYENIDTLLDDEKLVTLIEQQIKDNLENHNSLFVEDKKIKLSENPDINIITKAVYKENFPGVNPFPVRVEASIGEVTVKNGVPDAEYFFVTLYFSEKLDLTSTDFHFDFR